MEKRNVLLIVSAVLIVGVVIVGYFLWQNKKSQSPSTQPIQQARVDNNTGTGPTPSPVNQNKSTDSMDTNWNTLTNKFGWSLKYPSNWTAVSPSAPPTTVKPEDGEGVTIQGPPNCYQNKQHCGTFQIDARSAEGQTFSATTPQEFLMKYQTSPDQKIISQGSIMVGPYSGYQIVFNQTNAGGYPNGRLQKEIALIQNGKIYQIDLNDDLGDNTTIKSVSGWTLTPTFNQILATLKFQ